MAFHRLNSDQIPSGFTGKIGRPTCECDLIAVFGILMDKLGFLVERAGPAYPDLTLWWHGPNGPERLLVEVEVDASHFVQHGHDPAGCDLVLSWSDSGGCPVPVLSLESLLIQPEYYDLLRIEPGLFRAMETEPEWWREVRQRARVEPRVKFLSAPDLPPHFHGLVWPPENEQEVSVLLCRLLPKLRYCIETYDDKFPDIALWSTNEASSPTPVRTELEWSTRQFVSHRHPADKCDLVVAWKDEQRLNMPKVLALEDIARFGDRRDVLFLNRPDPFKNVADAIEKSSTDFAAETAEVLLNQLEKRGSELTLNKKSVSVRVSKPRGMATYFSYYPRPSANYVHPTIEFYTYALKNKGVDEALLEEVDRRLAGLPIKGGASARRVEIREGKFSEKDSKILIEVFELIRDAGKTGTAPVPDAPTKQHPPSKPIPPSYDEGSDSRRPAPKECPGLSTTGIEDVLGALRRAGALIEANAKGKSVRVNCRGKKATLFTYYPGGSANYPAPTIEFYSYQLENAGCPEGVWGPFASRMSDLVARHGRGKRIYVGGECFGDEEWENVREACTPVLEWGKGK